jgi:hypothetical protein
MSTELETVIMKAADTTKGGDYQRQCFLRRESRIRAIAREQLLRPTVDPLHLSAVALGAAPRIMQFRPRMEKFHDEVDLDLIDALPELAHALAYATGDYVRLTGSEESLQELIQEGIALRSLLIDVKELCERQGLIKGTHITQNPRLVGSVNVSRDLTAAKRFYEECDEELLKKLPITAEQIARADYLATRLLEGAGTRRATPAEVAEAELIQLQAFTCLMMAYDEARAIVKLLRRRQGDAEEIAPSPFAGRTQPRRQEDAEPEAPPAGTPVVSAPGTAEAQVPVEHTDDSPFTS